MKITLGTIMMLGILTFCACQKDNNLENAASYDGKWSLVKYNPNPLFGGSGTTTYNMGDIEWFFNSVNNAVIVTVNGAPSQNPLAAGTYNFQLGSHACNYNNNQYFNLVNNVDVEGVFVLDSVAHNKLRITGACFDGAILDLER